MAFHNYFRVICTVGVNAVRACGSVAEDVVIITLP